ncbi:MAG: two-component sensor histidine kinase [Crocinitomix sp.]|jgi:two-component sensor histidine kinase
MLIIERELVTFEMPHLNPCLMKLSIVLSLCTFIFFKPLYSQNNSDTRLDSLAKIYTNPDEPDTSRIDAMNHASALILYSNPDSCYSLIKEQLALSKKINDEKRQAESYYQLGCYHNDITGNIDSTLFYLRTSLRKSKKVNHLKLQSTTYNMLAISIKEREPDSSLFYYEKSIVFAEKAKYYESISGRYINMAQVYQKKGDFFSAFEVLDKAYAYLDKYPRAGWRSNAYDIEGGINLSLKEFDKALEYFEKSLELAEKTDNKFSILLSNLNMVNAYLERDLPGDNELIEVCFDRAEIVCEELQAEQAFAVFHEIRAHFLQVTGRGEEAKFHADQALVVYEENNVTNKVAYLKTILGNIALDNKDYSLAIINCKEAFELSENSGHNSTIIRSCNCLYKAYEATGKLHDALKFHVLYTERVDSTLSRENFQNLTEKEMQYTYEKKQLSDSLRTAEEKRISDIDHLKSLEKEKFSKTITISVAIGLFIIVLFMFREFQRKKKQTQVLDEKNALVNKSLYEKELLFKEVHHRVKNNFKTVSSLLELQSKGVQHEKALENINEGKNRIKAMALIHKKLYQGEDISTVDFQTYTKQLSEEIISLYNLKELELEVNTEGCHLDIDTSIPLGLILNELITNACKYAFESGRGKLSITLSKATKEYYLLVVKDNGKGLPIDLDLSKIKSLGLRLVQRLTKQLQGTFNYISSNGSVFEIRFKDTVHRKEID